nr:hypothetical protein [Bacteroidota bacterium]
MIRFFKTGLIVGLYFIAFSTGATNYFINSRIGNNSNDGISKESPWMNLVNLGKGIFQPGDSILFANGTSYKGGFIFSCSGTAAKPIVFSGYSLGPDIIITTPRNQLDSLF